MEKVVSRFKPLLFSFSFILLLAILAACGGSNSVSEPVEGEDQGEARGETETFTLTMNSAYPAAQVKEGDPKTIGSEKFAELIEERTDGRVKVDVYFSNQLAGDKESLDALANGVIDMQITTPAGWTEIIPEGSFHQLPFWSFGEDHTLHILNNTEVGKLYDEALEEYGVKKLLYWPAAMTGYMSTVPLASAGDFNGQVIFSYDSYMNEFYNALGGSGASVPQAELYEALSRGTVDAIHYSYLTLDTLNFHEVVNYISEPTNHPPLGITAISISTWDKLPEDIQTIILEIAAELEEEATQASKDWNNRIFDMAKEKNVEFLKMKPEDRQELERIAKETAWKSFSEVSERTSKMMEILEVENEKWLQENEYSLDSFIK